MRVLLAASEVVGFAKTGGLADVAGSLPRALAGRGHDCRVLLPLYRACRQARSPLAPTDHTFTIPIGHRTIPGRLWRSTLPGSDVPVYLVEQPDYFERDDPARGRGLYQYTTDRGEKRDYLDNCERFIFFSRAVLEAIRLLGWWPDVLHANDWQTGLIPVYLRELYQSSNPASRRSRVSEATDQSSNPASRRSRVPEAPDADAFDGVRTLFTIHNIAYQGLFWHWDLPLTGLDWRLFNYQQLEYHGHLNFLKAGIVFADLLNTVSPMYAKEIQTPYYGCGLQGVLGERKADLFGIVNGVDYSDWNPVLDRRIAANYDESTIAEGKPRCKAALQQRFGLPERPDVPLFGVIARLVEQKGIELIVRAAPALLAQDTQLVVLGEGAPEYHRQLEALAQRYPDRVAVVLAFDEALAHPIEAGADIFLMPSLYEPSGLNQLYSMKYGTVPVVRATGGLADTVVDATPENLAAGTATGFQFIPYTPQALQEAVERALALYRGRPEQWLALARNGMRQDWSWDRSAAEYEKLYEILTRR